MGRNEIAKVLKDNYPDWLDYKDIMKKTGSGKPSVFRALKELQKDPDIQYKVMMGKQSRWVTYYRWKR